ncbi:unnamed protein product [Auanema sp. JU1783]|nr:unnamed protein product [Auanema sp. JU1783]
MTSLLAGKISVITGGASGIGRAICQKFADQGAKVVVVDLQLASSNDVANSLGSKGHTSFACDVSQAAQVNALKEFVLKNYNQSPAVVVNCAGITQDSTLLKMTEEKFDNVVAVNLKGTFLINQAFARASVENKTPLSIVNVSSIIGKVGNFGQANYAATKAGVIAFSKSAAKELAKKGVRVNSVLPGFITTPMTQAMPPQVLADICAGIPMGRMGDASEIADAALFLASDLSTYVTGTTIEVTGGLHA